MKNKKFFRTFIVMIAALILMCGFSVTAYAGGGEDIPPEETQTTEPESTPPPNPVALTPDGNLTLVDDIDGEQTEDKQFITVVTKNGNYFYIIIDRAGDSDNVYFLNMVDEADLMAILEELDDTPTPPVVTPQPEPEPEPTPEPEPQPEKKGGAGGILLLLLLVAGAGGGAFYYFKIIKPKQGAQGGDFTELDELEFDDEDDDFVNIDADEPIDSDEEE